MGVMDDRVVAALLTADSGGDGTDGSGRVEANVALTFEGFVRLNGGKLIRCAYLVVGSREGAQDVVQVALVKLAERWGRIVAGGDPLPYARTAVIRTAISWRRRRWHGERPDGRRFEHLAGDELEAVESRDRLRRALATLRHASAPRSCSATTSTSTRRPRR
jgi:DNA-directed RNA polymerase specialized sigma24 family protein